MNMIRPTSSSGFCLFSSSVSIKKAFLFISETKGVQCFTCVWKCLIKKKTVQLWLCSVTLNPFLKQEVKWQRSVKITFLKCKNSWWWSLVPEVWTKSHCLVSVCSIKKKKKKKTWCESLFCENNPTKVRKRWKSLQFSWRWCDSWSVWCEFE